MADSGVNVPFFADPIPVPVPGTGLPDRFLLQEAAAQRIPGSHCQIRVSGQMLASYVLFHISTRLADGCRL